MATTTFVDKQTVIEAAWLNDVDAHVYRTEGSGTATVVSGTTSIAVTHGMGATPGVENINITFSEQGDNDYGRWWVDTITSTEFTLNVSADPGASNLSFGWNCVIF